jgi:hypothetical protein
MQLEGSSGEARGSGQVGEHAGGGGWAYLESVLGEEKQQVCGRRRADLIRLALVGWGEGGA